MLGIHADGFAGRNAKEEGIKGFHAVDKGGRPRVHFAGLGALRIIEGIDIPTATRDFPHQISARGQQRPEGFGRIGTGETTGHADHRNWFIKCAPHLAWNAGFSRGSSGASQRQHLIEQISGQRIDRGIFKGNSGRQGHMEITFQPPPQFQRHQ